MRARYDEAIQQLRYYLELMPGETELREAEAHIVVIETLKEASRRRP